MRERVQAPALRDLLAELASFEDEHARAIFDQYRRVSGFDGNREDFERGASGEHLEGGLTAEEYLEAFRIDWDDPVHVLSFAMLVEAQALDLYLRAARASGDESVAAALMRAAEEEREHLRLVGQLLERQVAGS
jgi:rubrerythrin